MSDHGTPDRSPNPPRPYLSCREVLDFLMSYLDGELTADQRAEFERHLTVCPSCVNYLNSYKATLEMARSAMASSDPHNHRLDTPADSDEAPVPPDLLLAIRRALRSTPTAPRP